MKATIHNSFNLLKTCHSNTQEKNKKQKVLQQWEETLQFVNKSSVNDQSRRLSKESLSSKHINAALHQANLESKIVRNNINTGFVVSKTQIDVSLSNKHIDCYNSGQKNLMSDGKAETGLLTVKDADIFVSKSKTRVTTKLSETMSRLLPVESAKLLYDSDGKLKLYIRNYVSQESQDKKKLILKIKSLSKELNVKIDSVVINGVNTTISI